MGKYLLSCIYLSVLVAGHIGFAMESIMLQQNQQKEDAQLRKKIAEFNVRCPVTEEALLPEIQLSIASYMMRNFLWDTATEIRENQQLGDSSHGKLQLAEISYNDKWLITVDEAKNNVAYIWCMATAQLEHTLNNHERSIYSVIVSPNDEHVVTSSEDGVVNIWNMISGTLERTLPTSVNNPLESNILRWANVYSDNTHVITVSAAENKNIIKIWSMETGELLSTIKSIQDHCIASLVIAPGCEQLVTVSCNFSLRAWDMVKGELSRTFVEESVMVVCKDMIITSDNKYLIVACNKKVRLWDMQTGETYIFKVYEEPIKSLCASLDKTKLIIMTIDGLIEVWSMAGQLLHTCDSGRINCVSRLFVFDRCGKKFLKILANKSVRIYEIETGLQYDLHGHKDEVEVLKVNSDGTQVVTGASNKTKKDTTTRVWSLKKSSARLWLENEVLPF